MRRLATSFILVLIASSGICQKIVVSSFEQHQSKVPTEFVKSLNGDNCALVLLHFTASNISVEGNVVRSDQTGEGDFNLWITPGTKMIRIKAEDKYPLLIKFNDYGFPVLDSGNVYNLSLTVQDYIKKNEVNRPEINDPLVIPLLNYNYDFDFNPKVDTQIKDEVDYALANLINKKTRTHNK